MMASSDIYDDDDQFDLAQRILHLRDDQLTALCQICIGFDRAALPEVVQDIRENGLESGHLPIVLSEAESPEDLAWWVELFEDAIRNAE